MAIHLNPLKVEPAATKAIWGMTEYLQTSEIDPSLRNLISIRASQINGCAFCLDMHVEEARQLGETAQRLDTLAAWRDTPFYSPAERAALALTERVTRLADEKVSDELDAELREHYSEKQIVQLLMAIIHINAWNRLIASTDTQPTLR